MIKQECTRSEWIEIHQSTDWVTASQVPTICGVNQWESALTLYARKIGAEPWAAYNLPMAIGHAMEPVIHQAYESETGETLEDYGDYVLCHRDDMPWLVCTFDRVARDQNGALVPVEFKTTGRRGTSTESAELQLQTQMFICGADCGVLVRLIANRELEIHYMRANADAQKEIIARAGEFRQCCMKYKPPAPDASESARKTLHLLHPEDTGRTVTLPELSDQVRRLQDLKDSIRVAEHEISGIENELRYRIADSTFAEFSDGWKASLKTSNRAGYLKLPLSFAQVLTEAGIEFTETKSTTFRTLRITKGNE